VFLLARLDALADGAVDWSGFLGFLISNLFVNGVNEGVVAVFAL
jgi:hypothetical protein